MKATMQKWGSTINAWFSRFTQGRNGVDSLCHFLTIGAVVVFLIFAVTGFGLLYALAMLMLIFASIRILSRNCEKRRRENEKYEAVQGKIRNKCLDLKDDFTEWRIRHFG